MTYFFNGLGSFSKNGDEYIIHLRDEQTTPSPWINILANPNFGTLVSESGQAFTWIENSHEFRLTPWNNDPIEDRASELFYLRNEHTGHVWSPCALPYRGKGDYKIRHGFGYSIFEHTQVGIYSELSMFVALKDPVKFIVLKIRNDSSDKCLLSTVGDIKWVLGDLASKNAIHVVSRISKSGAIYANNYYNTAFGERTAFFHAISLDLIPDVKPDPHASIQLKFDLKPNEVREIIFLLGAGQDENNAEALIQHYQTMEAVNTAFQDIKQYWKHTLNAVKITTPDPSVDFLANGWLMYQVISSRLWGRTAYYQCSGAFGFRDQLQDVMSLAHTQPELFRQHLLLCASRQFIEGDVQHWWHPPIGRGVRTLCSDDYLWLPFALCRYIKTTGDFEIINEEISYLEERALNKNETSDYELPIISQTKENLYQHAKRAILFGLKFGSHGLPLMGSGDWNDGMNLVGAGGKGESIWLGFFLFTVLKQFKLIADRNQDSAFAQRCEDESKQLQKNIEENGWDGQWYRRAYFDDGTPLGSNLNSECRIDSIAQSWSVLSGAAMQTRAQQSMSSLYKHLVRKNDSLIALLDPPFYQSKPNPGYIQDYVQGVRENGGQYTHAAVWAIMAFVEIGEIEKAWELFHIINPINHSSSFDAIARYKIEPYVVAGDVYSVAPHQGRGGWSWYSGSAGWMYRLLLESLLGLHLEEGRQLHLTPHLPQEWNQITIDYSYKQTLYTITIERAQNGKLNHIIDLQNDQQHHQVQVLIP